MARLDDRAAVIRVSPSGSEFRVLVNGSYRITLASEDRAREWCRRQGFHVLRIEY